MIVKTSNNLKYLEFEIYSKYDITAAFSTRIGGISPAPFDSLNLGFSYADSIENVAKNWRLFADVLGFDLNSCVRSSQTHTNNVLVVEDEHRGMGVLRDRTYNDIDALYTESKNVVIATGHADCTPVYFFDPRRRAIALAHAGWRGTAAGIVRKVLEIFLSKGSDMKDMVCAIGPAVSQAEYEVGFEVVDAMKFAFDISRFVKINSTSQRPHIDLKAINRELMLDFGVLPENIEVSEECTKTNSEYFFSHRRSGLNRGSHIACMSLKS